jgi:hypothetical protein
MKLSTSISIEEKYDSASVVVAPGGWCCCTCSCCHCWCHCHAAATMSEHDDEEL